MGGRRAETRQQVHWRSNERVRPRSEFVSVCPSQKRGYFSKAHAKVALKQHENRSGLSVYRCVMCDHWHLGHYEQGTSRVERFTRERPGDL